MQLTLVGRRYCSLCDKMRTALIDAANREGRKFWLTEIDLDEYPMQEDKFGELVPVLLAGEFPDGVEICHYHFDIRAWHDWINEHDKSGKNVVNSGTFG